MCGDAQNSHGTDKMMIFGVGNHFYENGVKKKLQNSNLRANRLNEKFDVFLTNRLEMQSSHSENHNFVSSIALLSIPIYMICQNMCIIFDLNIPSFSVALRN